MQKLSRVYIKFCDHEVSVASDEGVTVRIWSELNMFIDHRFAQIDLPSIESDISPAIHFDDMICSAVFIFCDLIAIRSLAGNIYVRGAFHTESFVRSFVVVAFAPIGKHALGVRNVFWNIVFEQFLIHGTMEPFDFSLRLRVLYAAMDRQNIVIHQPLFELCIALTKSRKLSSVVG